MDGVVGGGDVEEGRVGFAGAVEGAFPLDAAFAAPAAGDEDAEGFDGLDVAFVVEEAFAFEDDEVGAFFGGCVGCLFGGGLGGGLLGGLGVGGVAGGEGKESGEEGVGSRTHGLSQRYAKAGMEVNQGSESSQ